MSFWATSPTTHVLAGIRSRAFGDRGSVSQHTGIGCTAATLLLSLRYPTCNPCLHSNQEHKWENEFMSIAAGRTTCVCHLLPRRTIGGFGCRLVLCRHKAADVVLTSELLCMAAERKATTFSRGPERHDHPVRLPRARLATWNASGSAIGPVW